jgi:probable rRNA maturation factor
MLANVDLDLAEGVTPLLDEDETVRIVETVLAEEGVTRPCYVSVSVVDDERMRELNGEWRGMDRPTDVLSLECERPDDPDLGEDEPCELGDIVLAHGVCVAEAAERGIAVETHASHLMVHGVLHLLGYDHMNDDEAEAMEEIEREALGTLGIADPYLIREA